MEFTPAQIRAFRYWIQGYPNFYEPIVGEYFRAMGYNVQKTVIVGRADIQRVIDALFDGRKRLGPDLDAQAYVRHLEDRKRLKPDMLLEKEHNIYLAEFKSWGGSGSGQFDVVTVRNKFMQPELRDVNRSAFLLVDWLNGQPVAGKILVASARSSQHDAVLDMLTRNFNTPIQLLYLDEIYRTPQLAGFIERQMRYLEAAVAELKQALGENP